MSDEPKDPADPAGDPAPALRPEVATILATEHWSLLGTRSMTWNEIMSRITIYLTVVSAFLVVLALMAQATGFGTPFRIMSIGFAATALLLGTLTGMRVAAGSQEDAQLIKAMNRLRRAYAELAPEVMPYFSASTHDDDEGLMTTYALGAPRAQGLHFVASTFAFVTAVNTLIAGTLGALIASAAGASTALTVILGVVGGIGYLAGLLEMGRRTYRFYGVSVARFPTPGPGSPPPTVDPSDLPR